MENPLTKLGISIVLGFAILTLSACSYFGNDSSDNEVCSDQKIDVNSEIKFNDEEDSEVDRHDLRIGERYNLKVDVEARAENMEEDTECLIEMSVIVGNYDDVEKVSIIESRIDDARMTQDADNPQKYKGTFIVSSDETQTTMAEILFRVDDMPSEDQDDQNVTVEYESKNGASIYHDDFSRANSPRTRAISINKGILEQPAPIQVQDSNKITWDRVENAESYSLEIDGQHVTEFDQSMIENDDEYDQITEDDGHISLDLSDYDYEEAVDLVIVAEETEAFEESDSEPITFEPITVY